MNDSDFWDQCFIAALGGRSVKGTIPEHLCAQARKIADCAVKTRDERKGPSNAEKLRNLRTECRDTLEGLKSRLSNKRTPMSMLVQRLEARIEEARLSRDPAAWERIHTLNEVLADITQIGGE